MNRIRMQQGDEVFCDIHFLGRLFFLLTVPALSILAAQLTFTQSWFPACPNFLRALIWNVWFLCPVVPILLSIRNILALNILQRSLAVIFTLIFLPVGVLCFGHIVLFRCLPSFLSLQAIAQTDAVESVNFLFAYSDVSIILPMVLCLSVYAVFFRICWKRITVAPVRLPWRNVMLLAMSALFFFAVVMDVWRADPTSGKNSFIRSHYFLRTVEELVIAMRNERNSIDMARRASEAVDFGGITLQDDATQRTYVLILGEGASRAHMSLYGYSRPTSLSLDALRDELIIYDQIVSMFGSTAPSLDAAFLFPRIQQQQGIASILTLHRQAGFKIFWITNNLAEEKGRGSTWFAASADLFVNKNLAVSFTQLSTYDEVLLPELEKVLRDDAPNKFIVLHLAGMHPTQEFRFPPDKRAFGVDDTIGLYRRNELSRAQIKKINAYDSAMSYNNDNVRAIIDIVSKNGGMAYVLYISDHSQQLYEVSNSFQGHAPTGDTRHMYDIPFLIWLSPEYRERNQEFVDPLLAGRKRFGKMDDSFGYSLAELSRIGFSKFRPERSIFSKEYQEPNGDLGNGINYFSLPVGLK